MQPGEQTSARPGGLVADDQVPVTVLHDYHVEMAFKGSRVFSTATSSFRIDLLGNGSVAWIYDPESRTLLFNSITDTDDQTALFVTQVSGQVVNVEIVGLNDELGRLVCNTTVKNIILAERAQVDITVNGDLWYLTTLGPLNGPLEVRGITKTLEINGNLAGNLRLHGNVGHLKVGGQVSLGSVRVDGNLDLFTVGGDCWSQGRVEIGGNVKRIDIGGSLSRNVTIRGNLVNVKMGGVALDHTFTILGNLDSFTVKEGYRGEFRLAVAKVEGRLFLLGCHTWAGEFKEPSAISFDGISLTRE